MFEMPKFDMPKFDMQNFEVPAAFREIAEKNIAQAKETFEKMKSAAKEASDVMEGAYVNAAKGATDYKNKVLEATTTNAQAMFDFANRLVTVKSPSELSELATAYMHQQYEAITKQTKELAELAQKASADAAEPLQAGAKKMSS